MRCTLSRQVPSPAPLGSPLPRLRASQHRKQGIACAGLFQQPAYDKYRDPHDIENSFWKRIEDLACLTDEQKERRLTPWSFVAALPMIIKYRVLPFQVRFIWYIVWFYLRQAAYRVHKAAVLQGAKLDVALMRWRGQANPTVQRATILRRLHGKDTVADTALYRLGILQGSQPPVRADVAAGLA